jgi:hypothetical protein
MWLGLKHFGGSRHFRAQHSLAGATSDDNDEEMASVASNTEELEGSFMINKIYSMK